MARLFGLNVDVLDHSNHGIISVDDGIKHYLQVSAGPHATLDLANDDPIIHPS